MILVFLPFLVTAAQAICLPDPPLGSYYQLQYTRRPDYGRSNSYDYNYGINQNFRKRERYSNYGVRPRYTQTAEVIYPGRTTNYGAYTGLSQASQFEQNGQSQEHAYTANTQITNHKGVTHEDKQMVDTMFGEQKGYNRYNDEKYGSTHMYNNEKYGSSDRYNDEKYESSNIYNNEKYGSSNINKKVSSSVKCKPCAPIYANKFYGVESDIYDAAWQKIYSPRYLRHLQRVYGYDILSDQDFLEMEVESLAEQEILRMERLYGEERWRKLTRIYSPQYMVYLETLYGPDLLKLITIDDQFYNFALLGLLGEDVDDYWETLFSPGFSLYSMDHHINDYLEHLSMINPYYYDEYMQYLFGGYGQVPYFHPYPQPHHGKHHHGSHHPHNTKPPVLDRFDDGKNDTVDKIKVVITKDETVKQPQVDSEVKIEGSDDDDDEYESDEDETSYFSSRFDGADDKKHKGGKRKDKNKNVIEVDVDKTKSFTEDKKGGGEKKIIEEQKNIEERDKGIKVVVEGDDSVIEDKFNTDTDDQGGKMKIVVEGDKGKNVDAEVEGEVIINDLVHHEGDKGFVSTVVTEDVDEREAQKEGGGIEFRNSYTEGGVVTKTIEEVSNPRKLSLTIAIPPQTVSKKVEIIKPAEYTEETYSEIGDFGEEDLGKYGQEWHGSSAFGFGQWGLAQDDNEGTEHTRVKVTVTKHGGTGNEEEYEESTTGKSGHGRGGHRRTKVKVGAGGGHAGNIEGYGVTGHGKPGHGHVKYKVVHHGKPGHVYHGNGKNIITTTEHGGSELKETEGQGGMKYKIVEHTGPGNGHQHEHTHEHKHTHRGSVKITEHANSDLIKDGGQNGMKYKIIEHNGPDHQHKHEHKHEHEGTVTISEHAGGSGKQKKRVNGKQNHVVISGGGGSDGSSVTYEKTVEIEKTPGYEYSMTSTGGSNGGGGGGSSLIINGGSTNGGDAGYSFTTGGGTEGGSEYSISGGSEKSKSGGSSKLGGGSGYSYTTGDGLEGGFEYSISGKDGSDKSKSVGGSGYSYTTGGETDAGFEYTISGGDKSKSGGGFKHGGGSKHGGGGERTEGGFEYSISGDDKSKSGGGSGYTYKTGGGSKHGGGSGYSYTTGDGADEGFEYSISGGDKSKSGGGSGYSHSTGSGSKHGGGSGYSYTTGDGTDGGFEYSISGGDKSKSGGGSGYSYSTGGGSKHGGGSGYSYTTGDNTGGEFEYSILDGDKSKSGGGTKYSYSTHGGSKHGSGSKHGGSSKHGGGSGYSYTTVDGTDGGFEYSVSGGENSKSGGGSKYSYSTGGKSKTGGGKVSYIVKEGTVPNDQTISVDIPADAWSTTDDIVLENGVIVTGGSKDGTETISFASRMGDGVDKVDEKVSSTDDKITEVTKTVVDKTADTITDDKAKSTVEEKKEG